MNSDPIHDPAVASLIRQAAGRGAIAGAAIVLLLATVIALFASGIVHQFRQGAVWGFGIGLGVVLGGTVLNAVVGLVDQFKNDITGR